MQKEKIDIVILYDFLEHIKTPEIFLKELDKRIHNPDVIYLISVPTHKYRKVFGEDFHKKELVMWWTVIIKKRNGKDF